MPESDATENAAGLVRLSSIHAEADAQVRHDGRVAIRLTEKASRITKELQRKSRRHLIPTGEDLTPNNLEYDSQLQSMLGKYSGIPPINIAIHIVGSRGDVQPFIPIGQILSRPPYSHRVRICTHPVFKDFVEENELEFFSIGGDPAILMAYMVKNPGLMPGLESWKAGDVGKRRADIAEILEGCWRSCIQSGNGMCGKSCGASGGAGRAGNPFIADAIIANPPSYGHLHCAEKLGIPLHMIFTMPWSPTQSFPHPLASLERNGSDPHFANYVSYTLMELLAWQGLGDVINGFRINTLHLDPISPLWGHMLLSRMKVPFTYLWSSALIPKPQDWGSYINISGFSFLSLASKYKPPRDLVRFLEAGPPPVYIGFGSIVVDGPTKFTNMIFGAVKRAGVRALVSKGWGELGGDQLQVPDGVFLLGNCPHDWLFQHVSCVVHHGGAGTTAIGIAMGKPTVIIPFFGDQPFWGAMIYRAGAGPEPVPYKNLTEELLAESITKALSEPEIQTAVKDMSEKVTTENGAEDAATTFYQSLNIDTMRCLICPERLAVCRVRKTNLRLSSLAAATLIDNGIIELRDIKLIRHRDWYIDEGAAGPLMAAVAVASGTIIYTAVSVSHYFHDLVQSLRKKSPPDSKENTVDTPTLAYSESLDYVPSRFPVQAAANYSPQHLEALSYQLASKTLPDKKDRAKNKKTHSWSPISPKASKLPPTSIQNPHHDHGRVHDTASSTKDFTLTMVGIGLKAPVAFFYHTANGFHNAPLYLLRDTTVRRRGNITGFGSGVKVAGTEFVLGLYDGFTGIITLPYRGAKREGIVGFGKGLGQGLGGVVLKSGAAGFGLLGYTLKGVERQAEKRHDRALKAKILAVRIKQGVDEYGRASQTEKEEILKRWREMGRKM